MSCELYRFSEVPGDRQSSWLQIRARMNKKDSVGIKKKIIKGDSREMRTIHFIRKKMSETPVLLMMK